MRYFLKMVYLAFAMPKLYRIDNRDHRDKNPYLEGLKGKTFPPSTGSRYLDELRSKPPSSPGSRMRIQLPLILRREVNETDMEGLGWLPSSSSPRRPQSKKSVTSNEGTFRIEENDRNITFQSVGGYNGVKMELLQVIDILKNSSKYEEYGIRMPRGVLLEGPTGNGKTLMARAFAGEIEIPIIPTSGAEFNEKYVGVGASRIRELFNFAKENEPCIIFIDEIDALAKKRSNNEDGASDERSQTLNQLLVALDGFTVKHNVIVMGATNRIDILDPAVIRPGRMDKIIHVPNPDTETRREIVTIHLKNKPINVTMDEIVDMTTGMNGAQIENMLNEATLTGIRKELLPIDYSILEDTRNRIVMGQSIGKMNISDATLRRVAVHEIGHLLMALNSSHFDRPSKVTVDSSVFSSLGYTVFEKKDVDQGFFLREYLHDHLKVLLGGRVAEETVYGTSVSSGALSDLETAFEVAKKMIMGYGMGTHIIYPHFSETYKKRIDQEIHHLINNAYLQTREYLRNHKPLLEALAEKLTEKKTLYPKDFLTMEEAEA
uniref:AAA+ ATPase domain-containing protein n=1 Tax=viral metagenome TaxID=1070528 RepID=A0A6C0K4G5_9ZZZZ